MCEPRVRRNEFFPVSRRTWLVTYTWRLPGNTLFASFPICGGDPLTREVCSVQLSAFQNETEKPKMGSRKG